MASFSEISHEEWEDQKKTTTFTDLPVEILAKILGFSHDLDSFLAAAGSSRAFRFAYHVYAPNQVSGAVLNNQGVDQSLLPEVGLVFKLDGAVRDVVNGEYSQSITDQLCSRQHNVEKNWNLHKLIKASRLHYKIQWLADNVAPRYLRRFGEDFDRNSNTDSFAETRYPLSYIERNRVKRALYLYHLCCGFFSWEHAVGRHSGPDPLLRFMVGLNPWERAQISKTHEYLHDHIRQWLVNHPDVRVYYGNHTNLSEGPRELAWSGPSIYRFTRKHESELVLDETILGRDVSSLYAVIRKYRNEHHHTHIRIGGDDGLYMLYLIWKFYETSIMVFALEGTANQVMMFERVIKSARRASQEGSPIVISPEYIAYHRELGTPWAASCDDGDAGPKMLWNEFFGLMTTRIPAELPGPSLVGFNIFWDEERFMKCKSLVGETKFRLGVFALPSDLGARLQQGGWI